MRCDLNANDVQVSRRRPPNVIPCRAHNSSQSCSSSMAADGNLKMEMGDDSCGVKRAKVGQKGVGMVKRVHKGLLWMLKMFLRVYVPRLVRRGSRPRSHPYS